MYVECVLALHAKGLFIYSRALIRKRDGPINTFALKSAHFCALSKTA